MQQQQQQQQQRSPSSGQQGPHGRSVGVRRLERLTDEFTNPHALRQQQPAGHSPQQPVRGRGRPGAEQRPRMSDSQMNEYNYTQHIGAPYPSSGGQTNQQFHDKDLYYHNSYDQTYPDIIPSNYNPIRLCDPPVSAQHIHSPPPRVICMQCEQPMGK